MLRDYIELPLSVRVLCFGSLINRAGSFVLIFLTIYASEEMGYGVGFAAACMGVFGFGSMLGSMLGGHLADQIGRRTVMLIALLGGAAGLLLVSSMENRWAFMASVWVFAIVADMYRPAASAMLADLVPIDRRPHAFALMYISINLGFAIAPPIGGFLAEYSFQWLFWGDAITMLVYGLIILAVIDETLPAQTEEDSAGAADDDSFWTGVSEMFRDTTFVWFCFATFLIALVFMQGWTTFPMHIRSTGLSNIEFGLLMSVNGILIFLLQLPMTHWLNRFNPMTIVTLGGLLIAVGFGLEAVHEGFVFFAVTIVIWTLGEILQAPFKQAIVTNLAPVELRARYLGLFTMCYATALTIGAPIGGQVLSIYGPRVLWSGAFLIAMTAVATYLAIYRGVSSRMTEEEQESPPIESERPVELAAPAVATIDE